MGDITEAMVVSNLDYVYLDYNKKTNIMRGAMLGVDRFEHTVGAS